jgi:hypothetical protein
MRNFLELSNYLQSLVELNRHLGERMLQLQAQLSSKRQNDLLTITFFCYY